LDEVRIARLMVPSMDGPAAYLLGVRPLQEAGYVVVIADYGHSSYGTIWRRIHSANRDRLSRPSARRSIVFTTSGSGASISNPLRIRNTVVAAGATRLFPSRKA